MHMGVREQLEGHYRRIVVDVGGRRAWALNPGHTDRDFELQRPTIHPFYTPSGIPVTEHGAHNRVHHKGVWIGHAKVNGVNCFHDAPDTGRIRVLGRTVCQEGRRLVCDLDLVWEDSYGQPVAQEARRIAFYPDQPYDQLRAHRLDIRSRLEGWGGGELHLARDTHAFCGVRVLDAIDEDDGGTVANSEGQLGVAAVMGQMGRWIDTSGRVGNQEAGVALLVHPTSPRQPFFVRDYGTMLANLTLENDVTVPAGEALTQRFSVVAHDGPLHTEALDRIWSDFAASSE